MLLIIVLILLFFCLTCSVDMIHDFKGRTVNLTLFFSGDGHKIGNYHEMNRFQIQIKNPIENNRYLTDVQMHARLVSPTTIVPIDIHSSNITYFFNYTIYDIENYTLQVRISWLQGGLFDDLLKEINYDIKNLSNEFFLKYSNHIDEIVYENKITLSNNKEIERMKIKPNCTIDNIDGAGRWILVSEGKDCPHDKCVGSSESIDYLNDIFNFNGGRFVWSPFSCNIVLYTKKMLKNCFLNKNIRSLAFTGDSLLREFYQNLYILLADSTIKLQKLKKTYVLEFNSSNMPFRLEYYIDSKGWKDIRHIDVNVINVPIHKIAVRGIADRSLMDQVSSILSNDFYRSVKHRQNNNNSLWFYYQHPAIQREDPRVDRLHLQFYNTSKDVSPFAMMTRNRQEIIAKGIEKSNFLKNINGLINGLKISDSRWESSHDGIHYSLLTDDLSIVKDRNCSNVGKWINGYVKGGNNLCKDGSPYSIKLYPGINKCIDNDIYFCKQHSYDLTNFFGGVSRMITQVLLNFICN